jgi:hypothetical protein
MPPSIRPYTGIAFGTAEMARCGSANVKLGTKCPPRAGPDRGQQMPTVSWAVSLLVMSTGIRFSTGDEAGIISTKFPYTALNPYADETASYAYANVRKLALGLPASEEPVGAAFMYNTSTRRPYARCVTPLPRPRPPVT